MIDWPLNHVISNNLAVHYLSYENTQSARTRDLQDYFQTPRRKLGDITSVVSNHLERSPKDLRQGLRHALRFNLL